MYVGVCVCVRACMCVCARERERERERETEKESVRAHVTAWYACNAGIHIRTMNHFQRLNEVKELKIFFFAQRKYTEASIEQATVAMRCLGANSPEPHRRVVPGSDTSALRTADTSALRAEDQQLYNRTSLTSGAHCGSLSKQRELMLSSSWLSGITFFEGPSLLGLLTICLSPIEQCALVW